jgi:16S rRNA G966 N2-methylase RsmD
MHKTASLSSITNRWQEFYKAIRDPSWPECYNEHHFHQLPYRIQQEIINDHNGMSFVSLQAADIEYINTNLQSESFNAYANIEFNPDQQFRITDDFVVYYTQCLEGDGTTNGQDFPNVIRHFYPQRKFQHCLDWCSGAGFIGFRLLSDGICDRLTLQDCHQPAIDACKYTMQRMPAEYQQKTQAICSADLSYLDDTMVFDLVVGNPPPLFYQPEFASWFDPNYARILIDPGWRAHHDFLANIAHNLAPDGVILLKNFQQVSIKQYEPLLAKNGLTVTRAFKEVFSPSLWYLELGRI